MTSEELVKRVEAAKHNLALLQREFESGIEQFYDITKELLKGEHFHALSPVLDKLPVAKFKAGLDKYRLMLDELVSDAGGGPKKPNPAKDVVPPPPQG